MSRQRLYAQGTEVAAEKTQAEIQTLLRRYGADEFSAGWMGGKAAVQFRAHGRRVRFSVELPDERAGHRSRGNAEAETRRRWRCLLLAIKAKLEVVASGIASFEEEFLAHVVTDDGATIYEKIQRLGEQGHRLLPAVEA